jgi:hypothetical protein
VALGHGTFIAGIFRQVVPNATVLSVRIMHSDDVVNEGDLLAALKLLAARVIKARNEDKPELMIDAISLSLGYYNESGPDFAYSSALKTAIDTLLDLGVVVVAAAGNNASGRRFYPAAFAAAPRPTGRLSVCSVGALNPSGTRAIFSDDGPWVNAWVSGAAVLSTYPDDVRGSLMPAEKLSDGSWTRESLNPDDYRGGFCLWNGTSFSAPGLAARFVKALLAGAPNGELTDISTGATVQRALSALRAMAQEGGGPEDG